MSDAKSGATNATAPSPQGSRLREIGRSLAHRNFRLFFAGQSVSLLGTWMQQTAMTWLVYRLTQEHGQDSALLLGVTGFAGQIPVLLLGPFAGVYSDRWHRHRIVIATQTLSMLQAFLLWILTIAGLITVWQLIVLSLFLGSVNAFDMPTRQAFMTEMLDTSEDLANAIALNSSMVNGARLIGPSIAGIVISVVGEATCFLLNGISFLGVIAALLAMRIPRKSRDELPSSVLQGLREGFRYAFGFPPVLRAALAGRIDWPGGDALRRSHADLRGPNPARRPEDIRPSGWILGRRRLGGKPVPGVAPHGRRAGTVDRRHDRHVRDWPDCLFILAGRVAFDGVPGRNGICRDRAVGLVQHDFANDRRGTATRPRDEPLYDGLPGYVPLGEPGGRQPGLRGGASNTLRIGGVCCILGAVAFAQQLPVLRQFIRPIYTRMGILPAVAAGLQQATEQTVPPEEG